MTIQQLRAENAAARERLAYLKAIQQARATKKVTVITKSSLVIARLRAAVQDLKDSLSRCAIMA